MPRQLRKKTNLIKKSYDLLLVGRNLSCIFWFISEYFELIQFLPRVPGSAGSGQILKWRPSWSSPWEGKRQKFVACTRDTTELVGFAERFSCSFHLCEFSQKPAPSIFSFVFKKVHFYQNFVWVCVENESPIFACLLVTVSPRTRAPAY